MRETTQTQQDHQPNMPPTKNTFSCKFTPAPPTGATETFSQIRSHIRNYSVSATTQTKFWKSALFQDTSEQICANFDSHQTTQHPWMHPLNQKNIFSRYFSTCPPKNLQMSSNPLKKCASFSPKVQTRNSQDQQFQTNQKMPKTIAWPFSLDTGIAPQSSENRIL